MGGPFAQVQGDGWVWSKWLFSKQSQWLFGANLEKTSP